MVSAMAMTSTRPNAIFCCVAPIPKSSIEVRSYQTARTGLLCATEAVPPAANRRSEGRLQHCERTKWLLFIYAPSQEFFCFIGRCPHLLSLTKALKRAYKWTDEDRYIGSAVVNEPAEALAKSAPRPRVRDAEATKARILAAARKEFSRSGLGGARVDVIAAKAKANKRMIYHYFSSKDDLFQTVLEDAYVDIRSAEMKLDLDNVEPKEALERLVRFTWGYYLKNPEFLTLVNSENLHRARHLQKSEVVKTCNRKFVSLVSTILDRGVASGQFRPGVDPVQLNLTIAAIGYYYLTNRYTGSIVFERDLMAKDALEERLRFNIDTVLRLVAR